MDEVRPRQYNDVTVKVKTLGDDLDIKDVKSIDESELQSYLMGDPVVGNDDPSDELEPVVEEDAEEGEIPSVRSKKPSTKKVDPGEDDVEEYLEERQPKKEAKPPVVADEDEENIFATLNRDLYKAGIFSEEEEVADAAAFKDKFIKEINRGANNVLSSYLSQHGPEYQDAFDAIFVNGVPPETYFRQVEVIDDLEGMDLKSVDNQERLLRSYYKQEGYSSERINKKLENLKDSGFMEDEAEGAHEIMVNKERKRLEEEIKIAEQESKRREYNKQNYRASINKLLGDKLKAKTFDGIPVDQRTAGKIYYNLTADAYVLPDGRHITEFDKMVMELDKPENFEKKLKLAFLLEKGLDLSDIKKEAIKHETEETFEGLQRKKKKKEIPSSSQMRSFF